MAGTAPGHDGLSEIDYLSIPALLGFAAERDRRGLDLLIHASFATRFGPGRIVDGRIKSGHTDYRMISM